MAAQWPRVVGWMVATLPTLSGWSTVAVYDGPPVTSDNPPEYITIGYVDNDIGGSSTITMDPESFVNEKAETGQVRSELVCNSSDADMATVRLRAFALSDALDASIRADRTLGGTLTWRSVVSLTTEILSARNGQGTGFGLVLTLNYADFT